MRCALVSDIHANWQAWEAVLRDMRSQQVDKLFCLGDVVGYGPMPERVLESVCEEVDDLVLGNHDAAVAGQLELDIFSDEARRLIEWTRDQLGNYVYDFLLDVPLMLETEPFLAAHAEALAPDRYNYIEEVADAEENFAAEATPLLFVGHTHCPQIFVLDPATAAVRMVSAVDFFVQPDVRYIVNVGSVGDPRDGLTRACYCVYDTESYAVSFRRVAFDIDAFKADLAERDIHDKPHFVLLSEFRAEGAVKARAMQNSAFDVAPRRLEERRRVRHSSVGPETAPDPEGVDARQERRDLVSAMKRARREREARRESVREQTVAFLQRRQAAAREARRAQEAERRAAEAEALRRKRAIAEAARKRREHGGAQAGPGEEEKAALREALKRKREESARAREEERRRQQAEEARKAEKLKQRKRELAKAAAEKRARQQAAREEKARAVREALRRKREAARKARAESGAADSGQGRES